MKTNISIVILLISIILQHKVIAQDSIRFSYHYSRSFNNEFFYKNQDTVLKQCLSYALYESLSSRPDIGLKSINSIVSNNKGIYEFHSFSKLNIRQTFILGEIIYNIESSEKSGKEILVNISVYGMYIKQLSTYTPQKRNNNILEEESDEIFEINEISEPFDEEYEEPVMFEEQLEEMDFNE